MKAIFSIIQTNNLIPIIGFGSFMSMIFSWICLGGCGDIRPNISTHKVQKSTFEDKINIPGVIEAKSTRSISCPQLGSDATITWLIPEGTHVKPGDVVCVLEAQGIQTSYVNAVNELENVRAEYNKALANLELQYLLLESQVKIIESNTEIKRLDSLKMQFLSPTRRKILELQLQRAAIEKEKINKKLTVLEKINKSELHKMKLKIQQAENKVNNIKSRLDLLTVKSDVEGMVIYSMLWTSHEKVRIGDIVWQMMEIMKIPDMSGMTIKCFANETHYKQIEKDQKIDVVLDAHPEIRLSGKIRSKASVGKPVKEKSKVKQYEVSAMLDSAEFVITPGLTVNCTVYISEVPDTIVVPVVSVFDYDSSKVVYVATGNKYSRQIVNTGQSSTKEIIISSGLHEGESIALVQPPLSLIKENKQNKQR
jgi:HlyD family secretion protein